MARTPLEPQKYVRDRDRSSEWLLIIAPGQDAYEGYLLDVLTYQGILCVFIRIASELPH